MSAVGKVAAAAPTYVDGTWVGLRITTAGELVVIGAGAGGTTIVAGNRTIADGNAQGAGLDTNSMTLGILPGTSNLYRINANSLGAAFSAGGIGLYVASFSYLWDDGSGVFRRANTKLLNGSAMVVTEYGQQVTAQMYANVAGVPTPVKGDAAGNQRVADDFQGFETLAEQAGAAAVLTFTFAQAVQLVLIESAGAGVTVRAVLGTQTPSATLGVRVTDESKYLPAINTTTVKVYAPAGATVNVSGWFRS